MKRVGVVIVTSVCMIAVLLLAGYAIWQDARSFPVHTDVVVPQIEAPLPERGDEESETMSDTFSQAEKYSSKEDTESHKLPVEVETEPDGVPENGEQSAASTQAVEEQLPEVVTKDTLLVDCESQLLELMRCYTSEIEVLAGQARDEYHALPKEQQTKKNKSRIANDRLDQVIAVEDACDADVRELLDELTERLEEIGESTDVVSEIRARYRAKKKEMENRYYEEYRRSVESTPD